MKAAYGGPAFPRPAVCVTSESGDVSIIDGQEGVSTRDYFAGQALVGIVLACCVNGKFESFTDAALGATVAYKFADATMAERERES